MSSFLNILLYGALAATAFTLVIGIAAMFRKDSKEQSKKNNRLMRLRIIFQFIALVIVALLLFMAKKG